MVAKLAVDVAGAADLLSIPERTVWSEIASGRLKSFKLGKHRRIRVQDIEAYLERRILLGGAVSPRRTRKKPGGDVVVPFPHLERAQ